MLNKLSNFFDNYASGRNVLVLFALQILFNVVIFPSFAVKSADGQELPILDLMFGFTPEFAYKVLADYGEKGRATALFLGSFVDTIYPIVYTLLTILAITFLFKKAGITNIFLKKLNLLPIFAMIFDLIENAGIRGMIQSFPERNDSAAHLASTAEMLKWSFVGVTFSLILFGLIGWALKNKRKM